MALTLSETRAGVFGNLKYWLGTATFDSSYASGGESFTPANAGMTTIDHVGITLDFAASNPAGTLVPVWDSSAETIMLFEGNYDAADGPLQEIGTDNVSNLVVYLFVLGK